MLAQPLNWIRRSLARRLLVAVIGWSMVFTVVAVSAQTYLEYRRELDLINARLEQIRTSYLPSLSESLWNFNEPQIKTQLQGLLNLPDLRYVELRAFNGPRYTAGIVIPPDETIVQTFSLSFNPGQGAVPIGDLEVVVDLSGFWRRLKDGVVIILITQAFQIFLLAGLILAILQRLITYPLRQLAHATQALASGQLTQRAPWGDRLDEIGALATAFNRMAEQLQVAFTNLQASNERQSLILETSPTATVITDMQGEFRYVNQRFVDLLGRNPSSVAQDYYAEVADRQFVLEQLRAYGRLDNYEARIKTIEGRLLWALASIRRIQFAEEPLLLTAFIDITERREAEEALRASETRYRNLFDNLPLFVFTKDREGRYTSLNPALQKYLPRSPIGLTNVEFYPAEIAARIHLEEQQVMKTKQTTDFEQTLSMPDGQQRALLTRKIPLLNAAGESIGTLGVSLDITERKQAEEQVLFQKVLLECQGEAAIDGILVVDRQQKWIYFNRRFLEMWRLSEEAIRRWDTPVLDGALEQVLNPEEFKAKLIYLYAHPEEVSWDEVAMRDGRVLERYSAPVKSAEGLYYGRVWYYRDSTERRQAEQALRQRNAELLALNVIANILNEVHEARQLANDVLDKVLDIFKASGGWVRLRPLLGVSGPLELVAERNLSPAMIRVIQNTPWPTEAANPRLLTTIAQDLATRLKQEANLPFVSVTPLVIKDVVEGVLGFHNYLPSPPSFQEQELLKTIARQVGTALENLRLTEQVTEVEVLREVDRLRDELIANVSHELRTPLGLIMVFSTTLLREDMALAADKQKQFLRLIAGEAEKLETIVSNLLDLSRMQGRTMRLERQAMELKGFIREALAALQPQTELHQVNCELPVPPLTVVADGKRVEQVLRNLISNAVKYSPPGTTITVRGQMLNDEAVLSVSDQGIGLAPEDLERVFDRFYRVESEATHGVAGAGLGLAVCRGIIEAHGGRLWVESVLGTGSTFFFALPLTPPTAEPELFETI